MPDVVIRVRQRDSEQAKIGRDRVDQFPAVEKLMGISARGDDFRPLAELRRVVLGDFPNQPSDGVVNALRDGCGCRIADGAAGW